jgi:polysaccharide export outer membrane protein
MILPRRVPPTCALYVFLGLSLTAAGTSTAQERPPAPAPGVPASATRYIIGAGDVLQVFVWKEPELTREVKVRLDGGMTLPLVGEVEAAGRTTTDLTTYLRTAYARFISSPNVTVELRQANSARFYVLGLVLTPGEYPITGRVTVVQALALAGGFKEFAKTEEIVILRQEGDTQKFLPFNYRKLSGGSASSQNIDLRPGDTVLVP